MGKKAKDLTGMVFGRLTVKERCEDYVAPCGAHMVQWLCDCECANVCKVTTHDLIRQDRSGIKSCGCLARELTSIRSKKYNEFDLSGEYGIGKSGNTDDLFYFELSDYDKIKDIYWSVKCPNCTKVISGRIPGTKKDVYMHVLLGFQGCDHIDRNELNNLHNNLRPCTHQENCYNRERKVKSSKTGFTGIYKTKNGKYLAKLMSGGVDVLCKVFDTFEEAKIARLQAEAKYFREFSPHISLFEQYGITIPPQEER